MNSNNFLYVSGQLPPLFLVFPNFMTVLKSSFIHLPPLYPGHSPYITEEKEVRSNIHLQLGLLPTEWTTLWAICTSMFFLLSRPAFSWDLRLISVVINSCTMASSGMDFPYSHPFTMILGVAMWQVVVNGTIVNDGGNEALERTCALKFAFSHWSSEARTITMWIILNVTYSVVKDTWPGHCLSWYWTNCQN